MNYAIKIAVVLSAIWLNACTRVGGTSEGSQVNNQAMHLDNKTGRSDIIEKGVIQGRPIIINGLVIPGPNDVPLITNEEVIGIIEGQKFKKLPDPYFVVFKNGDIAFYWPISDRRMNLITLNEVDYTLYEYRANPN